jgi:tetratricopeptide (TPR) repeat protein
VKVELDTLAEVPERFMAIWQKIADKIIAYFSRAMLLAVGAVIVFAIAWGIGQWLDARREKATELLGKSIQIASAELLRDAEKPDDDSDVPRFKTTNERRDAVLKSLDELERDYSGSDAARRGTLIRAGLLYDQARFAEAEALYRKFVDSKPAETSLLAVANEGVGLCAEARSDFTTAAAAFERQASEPFARERGLWNQARVYAKQGNKQKAVEVYKDLLSKASAQSPLREEVQNRLAMLEQ